MCQFASSGWGLGGFGQPLLCTRDPEGPGARCFQRTLQDDDDGDDDDGDDDDDADDYDDDDDDDEEDDDEDLDEDDADYEEEIGALVSTYPRSYWNSEKIIVASDVKTCKNTIWGCLVISLFFPPLDSLRMCRLQDQIIQTVPQGWAGTLAVIHSSSQVLEADPGSRGRFGLQMFPLIWLMFRVELRTFTRGIHGFKTPSEEHPSRPHHATACRWSKWCDWTLATESMPSSRWMVEGRSAGFSSHRIR